LTPQWGSANVCECNSQTYIVTELLDFSQNRTKASKARQFC